MIDKMTESDGDVHEKEKEFLVNLIKALDWIFTSVQVDQLMVRFVPLLGYRSMIDRISQAAGIRVCYQGVNDLVIQPTFTYATLYFR